MKYFQAIKSFIKNHHRLIFNFLIPFTVLYFVILVFSVYFPEQRIQDYFIRNFSTKTQGSDEIALIVIDDKSNDTIRYPWKRSLYTDMFEYFEKYTNAKVVIFDGLISAYDTNNPKSDKEFFSRLKKLNKTILGFTLNFQPGENQQIKQEKDKLFAQKSIIKIIDNRSSKINMEKWSLMKSPKELFKNGKYFGHVRVDTDNDNVIRRSIPLMEYNGKIYPSLALMAYAIANHTDSLILNDKSICTNELCDGFKINIFTTKNQLGDFQTQGIYSVIKWKKLYNQNYSHKKYSAIDILTSFNQLKENKTPLINPEVFNDKYIIIGANANVQNLEDTKTTPLSTKHAGVDIQATILDNIINNESGTLPNPSKTTFVIWCFCIFLYLMIRRTNTKLAILSTIILFITYGLAIANSYSKNILLPIATPFFAISLTWIIGYFFNFIVEGENRQKIQDAMGKYISTDIMNTVVKNIDNLTTGGKRADVTVLFVDIRGFTSLSEQLPPEDITCILNDYFAALEPIIEEYNGVIYKFIGDAIMAVFGDPIADVNHAKNAVFCANKILAKIKTVQKEWIEQGKPKIDIGVGINSGEVFAGNIGTSQRLEYTVIGDVVNLAHRIESFNKVYKTSFLISQSTYLRVRSLVDVILIRDVNIRGKAQKINIYEVLRIKK